MRRFWHELIGLDQTEFAKTSIIGFIAPDALIGIEHAVVVTIRRGELDGQTVRGDAVSRMPAVHAGPGAEHDAGEVGAQHVIRLVMGGGGQDIARVAPEEGKGRHGLEDRAPHRVVVDATCHGRHQYLPRAWFRSRYISQLQRLRRIAILDSHPVEHVCFFFEDDDSPVSLWYGETGEVMRSSFRGQSRVDYLFHPILLEITGNPHDSPATPGRPTPRKPLRDREISGVVVGQRNVYCFLARLSVLVH